MAQCDDLFISEYVEGYANNKALEIYNPTNSAIDLSEYSLGRFSNGDPTTGTDRIIQLPQVMLAAKDVFVVVLDKQDMDLWNSDLNKPVWNGFNLIDTIFDLVSGEPITDDDGNVIFGPQYEDGNALFGTEYNERYDLQCKADVFMCPVYNTNNTMYFNGNDAVGLIYGTEVLSDGSNLVDVIGVIGEDPTSTIGEDAWVDVNGYWLTKDRSLVRRPEITTGRNDIDSVAYALNGYFNGWDWLSYPKNSFDFLGIHKSDCNSTSVPSRFSCSLGPIASTFEVNQIAFNMYPNPNASRQLTIEADENIQRITIFNLLGQQVFANQLGGTNKTDISIHELSTGMYLVNLYFDEQRLSIQKLLVE